MAWKRSRESPLFARARQRTNKTGSKSHPSNTISASFCMQAVLGLSCKTYLVEASDVSFTNALGSLTSCVKLDAAAFGPSLRRRR